MTDHTKLHTGCTRASVGWRDPKWKTRKKYQCTNKEVFKAELYAMEQALEIALEGSKTGCQTSRQHRDPT